MHGAGSPQAQRIMISRLINIKKKQETAKRLAGIAGDKDAGSET
jgi:4-hydroxybutyryl-CoA dehydratase/vinylacetyl-CoA-Delta-isomerase